MTKSIRKMPSTAAPATFTAASAIATSAVVAITAIGLGITARQAGSFSAMGDASDLCRAIDDAFLSGTLYGAIESAIEWRGTDMKCEGGGRPDADGVRLVFASPDDAAVDRIVFVLGIAGTIDDLQDSERAANVTIIDEASSRFFNSGRQERCWTTVTSVVGDGAGYSIGGELYCSGSLPSLSDSSSVSLGDFRYSGRVFFDAG